MAGQNIGSPLHCGAWCIGVHLRANGPVEAHDDIGRCRPASVSGNLSNLSNSCRFANCFTKTDEDGDAAFDFQNDETEGG